MARGLYLAALFALTWAYTNCAKSLPDDLFKRSIAGQANPASILVGDSSRIEAHGGAKPYSYTVRTGGATVDKNGFVTGLAEGPVTIEVRDKYDNVVEVSLTVSEDEAPPAPMNNPCTTANGQSIAHGVTVSVYPASSVKCPATCQAKTLTCTNGALMDGATVTNGVTSCSVQLCVYKLEVASSCPSNPPTIADIPAACANNQFGERLCHEVLGKSGNVDVGGAITRNQYRCSTP